MSKKGPSSPGKDKLIQQANALPKLEHRIRELISTGAQSIVLSDGHNYVLLITRYVVAKKIELLREQPKIKNSKLIELPILVGTNADVIALLAGNANPSKNTRNSLKKELGLSPELLTQNIVYRLPRHEGNLETLGRIRFKEDTIENLEQTLYSTIEELHDVGFTHNDICKKNVLYSGTYPGIIFRLCDWGSVTQSSPNNESQKYDFDYQKVARVVGQAKDMLGKREQFKEKTQSSTLMADIFARKIKEFDISPLKSVQPNQSILTEEKSQIDKVKVNLLSQFMDNEDSELIQASTTESKEKSSSLLIKFNRKRKAPAFDQSSSGLPVTIRRKTAKARNI